MADFGGELRMTIGAQSFVLRGTVTINPTNIRAEAMTNMDGSVSRKFTPEAYGFDVKELEDSSGIDWNALMRAPPGPVVIVEEQTGVTHTYPLANIVGQLAIDRETGSVTGFSGKSKGYFRKNFS